MEYSLHRGFRTPRPSYFRTFLFLAQQSIHAVVMRMAEAVADAPNNEDIGHVSSHNLHRCFVQQLLVEKESNLRIDSYLNAPTADIVDKTCEEVGLA